MRNKIHKAISKNNGLWYEGYYVKMDDTSYCFEEDYINNNPSHHYLIFDRTTDWGLPNDHLQVEIDIDTLCQCTGLKDSENVYIYENDIVENDEQHKGIIYFEDKWCIKWKNSNYRQDLRFWVDNKLIKVIDNKFNYDYKENINE